VTDVDEIQALERCHDKSYWHAVHEAARRSALQGYEKRMMPDMSLRIHVIRTLLHIPTDVWSGKALGHAMFGGDPQRASERYNKFKQGKTTTDETEASMLASLVNCFLNERPVVEPLALRSKASGARDFPTLAERLQIADWVLAGVEHPDRLTAPELTGDIFAFTRKLHAMVAQQSAVEGERIDPASEAAVHDLLMSALSDLVTVSDWDHRLVIQHPRERSPGMGLGRFGAEQKIGTDPRKWQPVELLNGRPIEYGVPVKPAIPSQGWLVTVRDPWPVVDGLREREGEWVWKVGWDNIVRWLPSPFLLDADADIAAPTSNANTLLNVKGLFRVFMLTEPQGSPVIRNIVDDATDLLNEASYFRLNGALDELRKASDVNIYTGSYLVA
jgi:hypothetical protein